MILKFSEVLEIKNGKNQKKVEKIDGKYPIYGSGGIIGWADDYLCEKNNVIIGRKGNINKPLFVDKPFWNVDTAFGLISKEDILNSKYLYYFCLNYNFEKLNTTVTIPSLTKNNLLNIKINVPDLKKQEKIVKILDNIKEILLKKQNQISSLNFLSKCLFCSMFRDLNNNSLNLPMKEWKEIFLTTTGKLDSNAMVLNGKYPFFTCAKESFWINEYAFDCEALLLAGNNAAGVYDVKYYKGKFNAYQRTYVLQLLNNKWSYLFFKKQLEEKLIYLKQVSKGTNTRYLTLEILKELKFIVPSYEKQEMFNEYILKIEKSKFALSKSLKFQPECTILKQF